MPSENPDPLERVKATYQQLADVAVTLNASSDNLSSSIASLDTALRKLKLGIESWFPFRSGPEHPVFHIWHDDIGYAKIGGKWGLAIRQVPTFAEEPEPPEIEKWPFNDAPRMLRVKAVDSIPKLLEKLLKDAKEAVEKVNRQAKSVDLLTAVINDIPEPDAPGDGKPMPPESVFHRKLRASMTNQGDQPATDATVAVLPDSGKTNAPAGTPRTMLRPGRNNP